MALTVRMRVAPDGQEPYVVAAGAVDLMIYESAHRTLDDLDTLQGIYRLAYIASRRQGLFEGSRAEFETSCDVTDPPE